MGIQIWYDGLELTSDPYMAELQGKDDVAPAEVVLVPVSGGAPAHGKTQFKELVLNLNVGIKRFYGSADYYTYRHQLAAKFDTRDSDAKKLKILSQGTTRYLMCRPRSFIRGNGPTFTIQLVAADGRWLSETEHTDSEAVTSDGQTWTVSNAGNVAALPEIRVTPTSYRSGGYQYRRWVPIHNRTARALEHYPLEITSEAGTGVDTTGWVSGSKMQADGDDLRVLVDGEEVDRWFGAASGSAGGPNSATTKVWINIDLAAKQELTETVAIAGSGDVDTITVAEDLSAFPASGIVVVYSGATYEAFSYTGKDTGRKQLTGVTRAMRGTSAMVHDVGSGVYWVEHDIWLVYGDASASAPDADDDAGPIFDRASSTNTSWVYSEFATLAKSASGEWRFVGVGGVTRPAESYSGYTGNHGLDADPATEMGLMYGGAGDAWWWLYNPIGIDEISMAGEKWIYDTDDWENDLVLEGSPDGLEWTEEWNEGAPSSDNTFENWTHNSEAVPDGTYYVRMLYTFVYLPHGGNPSFEANSATVVLESSNRPWINLASEEQVYPMAATITNVTTGDAFELDVVCDTDETIAVDVVNRTVENETDQANAYAGFTALQDGDWLTLAPGSNTLRYEESGVAAVTVQVKWRDTWN